MRLPRVQFTVRALMLLTIAAALPGGLYVQTVRQRIARFPMGNMPVIPIQVVVLDADTGEPVRGAMVDLPSLRPSWRDRPEMKVGDLRREHPPYWRPSPLTTDAGGAARAALKGNRGSRIEYHVLGLLPVAGPDSVVFHPTIGLRVEADGYQTWVAFLNDIKPDDGRRLDNLIPMPITVRLKPVGRRASP